MEMTCEGCLNAAKRVLAKIGGMDNMYMYMSMVMNYGYEYGFLTSCLSVPCVLNAFQL